MAVGFRNPMSDVGDEGGAVVRVFYSLNWVEMSSSVFNSFYSPLLSSALLQHGRFTMSFHAKISFCLIQSFTSSSVVYAQFTIPKSTIEIPRYNQLGLKLALDQSHSHQQKVFVTVQATAAGIISLTASHGGDLFDDVHKLIIHFIRSPLLLLTSAFFLESQAPYFRQFLRIIFNK